MHCSFWDLLSLFVIILSIRQEEGTLSPTIETMVIRLLSSTFLTCLTQYWSRATVVPLAGHEENSDLQGNAG
jgi:hypothetical protein